MGTMQRTQVKVKCENFERKKDSKQPLREKSQRTIDVGGYISSHSSGVPKSADDVFKSKNRKSSPTYFSSENSITFLNITENDLQGIDNAKIFSAEEARIVEKYKSAKVSTPGRSVRAIKRMHGKLTLAASMSNSKQVVRELLEFSNQNLNVMDFVLLVYIFRR